MDNIIEDTRIVHTWKLNYTINGIQQSNSCQFPQNGRYANNFILSFGKNTGSDYYSYYLNAPSFNIKGTMAVFLFMLELNHENSFKRIIERKLTCICSGNRLDKFGFSEFCTEKDLPQPFVSDKIINLGCELIFCSQLVYSPTTSSLLHYKSMQNQFKELLENNELSDFTIAVGAEEIKVHKAILAARSPVFKTMLTINMTEKKTNRLKIEDTDLKIVKVMIQFIYTNRIDEELDPNEAEQLLILADKYELEDLKDLCTNFLERSLNIGNVTQQLLLAAQYKSVSLMYAVRGLMKRDPSAIDNFCDGMLKHF